LTPAIALQNSFVLNYIVYPQEWYSSKLSHINILRFILNNI
jgi:hypothetical protein